jgi:hypothetical protein
VAVAPGVHRLLGGWARAQRVPVGVAVAQREGRVSAAGVALSSRPENLGGETFRRATGFRESAAAAICIFWRAGCEQFFGVVHRGSEYKKENKRKRVWVYR